MQETSDEDSIPGLERSPGRERGNPLQYSCLESPKDRGAWWAMVRGGAKIRTGLKQVSTQSLSISYLKLSPGEFFINFKQQNLIEMTTKIGMYFK